MIDLHSHVLPGVDDGAPDAETALALALEVAGEGVEVLAATPHVRHDFPAVVPAELPARTAALQGRLDEAGVALRLVSAAEVDLVWAEGRSDEELRAVSYGGHGRWLLLETPNVPLTPVFAPMLFAVQARGFGVLLAHPERNATFQRSPQLLADLVRQGVLLQLTAASLVAGRRAPSRQLATALVRDGLAHVIASDRHGPGNRVGMAEGVRAAAREDAARATWMATEVPAAILAGEQPGPPPERRRRRRLPF
jgi:protein-tyrosine phosphatase